MKKIALQISPTAKSAYFKDYLQVSEQELKLVCGETNCNKIVIEHLQKGPLEFFLLDANDINQGKLLRLSFTQGLFSVTGEQLQPLDSSADFHLHEDFVFGSKFKGKTNEYLTQMLINIGLASISETNPEKIKLLDPMCGRATTLLWAMRYGIKARGIEQDTKALGDIRQNLKKWTKLHRQKHKINEGFVGKANKQDKGKFLEFSTAESSMKVVTGDARNIEQSFKQEKFDLLVSDLPYGVQHFTTDKTRNPLAVIDESVEQWKNCLKTDGAIVLAFNRYIPKRAELIDVFEKAGFSAQPFSAEHRMSESIVRDVVIFKSENL